MTNLVAAGCDRDLVWFDRRRRLDVVDLERAAQPLTVVLTPEARDMVGRHGGNFFGQPVALVSDALNIAMVQLANLAERQLDLLMDPGRNGGLPPFLSADPGAQSGMTGVNIAATAIVAHMRRMATPASIQSLPTNLHNQDIVPLGTQAALEAKRQVTHLQWIQGSLAVALRQAASVGGREPRSPAGRRLLERLAVLLAPIDPDRPLDHDVRRAAALMYDDER